MDNVKTVLLFAGKYLGRYWDRLALGVLFGFIFAIANASFIWATRTLMERLNKQEASQQTILLKDGALAKGARAVEFPIALARPENQPVEIRYHTSGGSAREGVHFKKTAGSLLIPAGSTGAVVRVPLLQAVDEKKTFSLEVEPPPSGWWLPRHDSKITLYPATLAHRLRVAIVNRAVATSQKLDTWLDPWLPRIDQALGWKRILGSLLFLPILVGIRSIADYLNNYCIGWVSERSVNDLRVDIMHNLTGLSLDFFTSSKSGDLLTRVNSDTTTLLRALRVGVADLIKEPLTVLAVIVGLLLQEWRLTLAATVFLPLCILPLIYLGKKARAATKASLKANINQANQFVEFLANIRVVKAFSMELQQIEQFRKLSRKIVHHGIKGVQAKELINPILEIVSMLGLGVLLIFLFQFKKSGSELIGFLTGLVMLMVPLKKIANVHILFEQASVAAERLIQVLREQPTVKEPEQPKTLPRFQGEITFENLSFSYGHRPVLQEINLRIPRGHKVGIVGESGSGKSTLVNLLFRFYDPTGGAIKIDGIDLRDLRFRDLRTQMALVSQEVVLFDQSVADNIACGKPGATREEIQRAAEAAYAHNFILQLPQGYETEVGERAMKLSGGQRQRLAIARAFIRDAPILVLDEATASLDSQAESEVQAALDHIAEQRTVICVAHRLSTLAKMDEIIVLAEGRVVEKGSFQGLLESGGVFARMAARQGISRAPRAVEI